MAPQQIGQFTILSELSQSEGGVVYKASDPKGKTVALRTLRLDAPGAAEIVPGFRAAAKAASALSSPNVAGIFGGGEANEVFFVAVEFVEGVKLSSTLAKGEPSPMSEVIDLCRQVCTGLDHAHAKGIVHGELKPSNIIVEWDGTAKILDFGVPRRHPAGHVSEATYYLSPEEVRGEVLSPRSNLFSWGAMLYQMVSGHKPFNAADDESLRRKIVEEMPCAPDELNPDVPPRVSEIILKALAKAPGERYASGAELLSELENYKQVEATPHKQGAPKAAAPASSAGTQLWTPGSEIRKAIAGKPAAPPPAPPPAPVAKPRAAPAPPKPAPPVAAASKEPPRAPAPAVAAAKAAPAAAKPAGKAPARNPLIYVIAGAIALLLIGIAVGGFWLLRSPSKSGTAPAPPTSSAAPPPVSTPAPAPEAAPATPAPAAAGKTRKPKPAATGPVEVAPATGGLSLDSSPQGAEVQIDGRHEAGWVTPFTATGLAVGSHVLSFSKPGHTGLSRTAQVTAGQNAVVAVQLPELPATLSVNSQPAGAAILVDGRDTGKLTPAQLVTAKGAHTVVVRKSGYLEASGTVQTSPGLTVAFSPTLKATGSTENIKTVGKFGGIFGGAQENSGRVSVRTNPKGAQVLVNGNPLKKTTPVDFYLESGSYEITLSLEGYKPIKKTVDVQKGGKLTVDETLAH